MIEQIASQILNDMKSAFAESEGKTNEASARIRAIIESKLRDLNLVTREEFDAQTKVLARTREKVETLEHLIAELEGALKESKS